jgi:hypothetical protein
MFIDRRHKYFLIILAIGLSIFIREAWFPEIAYWKFILFVWIPVAAALEVFARFMGWVLPEPTDEWDSLSPEERERQRFGER